METDQKMNPTSSTIIAEIKARSEENKIKPKRLATDAGLADAVVRNILNGTTRSPRVDTLQAIAGVLGCKLSDLTGDGPTASPRVSGDTIHQTITLLLEELTHQGLANLNESSISDLALAYTKNATDTEQPMNTDAIFELIKERNRMAHKK